MYREFFPHLNVKEPYKMDNMRDQLIRVAAFLFLFSAAQCQDKNNKEMHTLPEYNVMISHPDNKLEIEFVSDKIKTLENVAAHLPYGGTSGSWGDSGKGWTEQHGTPIGADIVYYAGYEDAFYHLDVDFPVEQMKDWVRRAYATDYADGYGIPLQEYIVSDKNLRFSNSNNPYDGFSNLVFGFAPKGMVVVWMSFGNVQMEVGRYQAKVIEEDKEFEKKLFASWSMNREQVRSRDFNPNASPQEWDNYRHRYHWKPVLSPDDKHTRMASYRVWYYNGEQEIMLRPWISQPESRERAIPKEIQFFWKKGEKEVYEGRLFFNWTKTNEAFKKLNNTQGNLEIKVASDNNSIEVLLDGHPLDTDSIRIYKSDFKFPIE